MKRSLLQLVFVVVVVVVVVVSFIIVSVMIFSRSGILSVFFQSSEECLRECSIGVIELQEESIAHGMKEFVFVKKSAILSVKK
jgi:hypothetical protein